MHEFVAAMKQHGLETIEICETRRRRKEETLYGSELGSQFLDSCFFRS